MSLLAELFRELGLREVETFIASGNVVFETDACARGDLERRISSHLESRLGYPVDSFVRTAEEVVAIERAQLFANEGQPGILVHVGFLPAALPAAVASKLAAVKTDVDAFKVAGSEFYWICTSPSHESKVWASPDIRGLNLPSFTLRNRTSLHKLVAKHLT